NRVAALTYDFPFRITSAPATPTPSTPPVTGGAAGATTDRALASQHQATLPPNNIMDTISAHLVVQLRQQTTISAVGTLLRTLQNDRFLPFTLNETVVVNPGQLGPAFPLTSTKALPEQSLEGRRDAIDSDVVIKTRLRRFLDLYVRHSLDRTDDRAREIVFP